MSVRGKILAALAVPVLVLFAAAAIISAQAIGTARDASQTSALVAALAAQDAAGTEIAAERTYSFLDANSTRDTAEEAEAQMMAQREKTDRALDARDRAYERLNTSALDPRVRKAVADTIGDRSELVGVRQAIDRSGLGQLQRNSMYSDLIDAALDVPRTLADTTPDRSLAQYLDTYVLLDELLAQQALEQPLAGAVLQAAQAGQQNTVTNQQAAVLVTTGDTLAARARAAVRQLPGEFRLETPTATYNQIRQNLIGSRPAATPPSQAAQWPTLSQEDRDQTAPVRDAVRTETAEKASDLAGAATTRAVITILVTLAAVVASILVAGFIARAIVNPLRRLTDAAEDVRDQLPKLVEQVAVPGQGPGIDLAPITVESSDEVGQLATAFNDVNQTTIKVAREQAALRGSIAEMFVNVARRDQVLLNRQLAFLDDLERSEEDAGTLSNLFRLDHLATRMRRNAESLLVLAGIDSGRRVRQPMPASDVIRTASSEIELYDRVRLNLVVDPLMLGHNALNAAHLLAELLENATMFSEPHTPVEVTTGRDADFVHITVRDHGLGMTAEEIAEANRKVATHAASDVVGAQRLGLFVVGRLSERLGAKVRFSAGGDEQGTEVVVSFPAVLFVPDSNVPLPQPTDPLETSTQAAAQQLTSTGVMPALPAEPAAPAPVPTASVAAVEPEAPAAVPVDLDALTDGTTQTGMPRRRSRTVDPAAAAPSASFASGPQTGAIVLPPLATPALPDELPAADEAWTPPAEVAPAASALPSRSRAAATPVEPVSAEIPVLDVSTRSALFSSFRPVGERPVTENPVELPVAPDVTATDIPLVSDVPTAEAAVHHEVVWTPPEVAEQPAAPNAVTGVGQAWAPEQGWAPEQPAEQTWTPEQPAEQTWTPEQPAEQTWTPEQPAEQAWEPEPAQETASAGWAPSSFAEEPLDATRVVPPVAAQPEQPAAERAPLADRSRAAADATEVRPVAPSAPEQTDVPVVAEGRAADGAEEIPAELSFEALPRFEELMADLPTRRSLRESQARKRGLFGRRPRTTATPQATRPAGPSAEALASRPAASTPAPAAAAPAASNPVAPAPAAPAPVQAAPAARQEPGAPARTSAFAPRADLLAAPTPSFAPEAPAAPVQETRSLPPVQDDPYPAARPSVPEPAASAAAWDAAPARDAASGYGPPSPLARRPVAESLEPLDAGYVSDSVEARSDWMASAVLYEEMSTLLQGSTDFQEATLADPNDGIYQPLKVDAAASGLARRSRGEERDGYVDRFTARIDRDPEQLRARLSAFQSATARGRVEGQDETSSTWNPEAMDYVPDSAPQAR
ncbi:nitrate- and nitrite sensing domain-containing protein [Cellulosimicrobium sp. XJ-DQ-B-000]|uniref:sensor histidine kinase n=1 Tax=Cellulosimicrobium sp. XJ-DQ-B-000 TaxID=3072182 RepID=UPI0028068723|nr:ATP-binding protein [Cellulosimicrobium sp. XJ-DQ-B-000]MDQ8041397.1 nitrate- and nitrite sensing domain-containing protein [Cellulosimicrobium sp. XJ-DQ-B-000]